MSRHAESTPPLSPPLPPPRCSQTDSRKDSRSQRQLLDAFKLRVLALLEIYIKKAPSSPHLPLLVAPLLRALSEAARPSGSAPLAQRITGLLRHVLPKARPQPQQSPAAVEQLVAGMRLARLMACRCDEERTLVADPELPLS